MTGTHFTQANTNFDLGNVQLQSKQWRVANYKCRVIHFNQWQYFEYCNLQRSERCHFQLILVAVDTISLRLFWSSRVGRQQYRQNFLTYFTSDVRVFIIQLETTLSPNALFSWRFLEKCHCDISSSFHYVIESIQCIKITDAIMH